MGGRDGVRRWLETVGDGRGDGLRSQRACGTPCCRGRSEKTDQEQKNKRPRGATLQQLRSGGWSCGAPREGEGKQQAFALFCRAFECSCEAFEDDPTQGETRDRLRRGAFALQASVLGQPRGQGRHGELASKRAASGLRGEDEEGGKSAWHRATSLHREEDTGTAPRSKLRTPPVSSHEERRGASHGRTTVTCHPHSRPRVKILVARTPSFRHRRPAMLVNIRGVASTDDRAVVCLDDGSARAPAVLPPLISRDGWGLSRPSARDAEWRPAHREREGERLRQCAFSVSDVWKEDNMPQSFFSSWCLSFTAERKCSS